MAKIKINDKKTINGWALFDWANSAYALVISTAIFPFYFTDYTPANITLGPWNFSNSSLFSFAVSFSYLLIAILSPILSGMADYSGRRKYYLKIFTIIGSLSCIALFFFKGEPQLWLGTAAFILATIGFAGGIVFYNSYLPIIVTEDRYDKVSAKGFAAGYIGSVLLLIFILMMVLQPQWFGIEDGQLSSRIGFVLVGLWWLGFGFLSFKYLPKDERIFNNESVVTKGFEEIRNVYRQLDQKPDLKKYLSSFFFYSAGVQTIIYLATLFAKEILGFELKELIVIVLILQIVGIAGAYLFAYVSKRWGNKMALYIMITIWLGLCIAAHFCDSKTLFYYLAALVGLVMGGIQSVSRSTYSKMLDKNEKDLTSYFSFYDVLYKLSIVAGTLAYGIVDNLTGNMRYSVLALAMFFVIGLYLLYRTNFDKAMKG